MAKKKKSLLQQSSDKVLFLIRTASSSTPWLVFSMFWFDLPTQTFYAHMNPMTSNHSLPLCNFPSHINEETTLTTLNYMVKYKWITSEKNIFMLVISTTEKWQHEQCNPCDQRREMLQIRSFLLSIIIVLTWKNILEDYLSCK